MVNNWSLYSVGLKRATVFILFLIGAFALQAQSVHQALQLGDSQYLRDNFKEAEKAYRVAADLEFSNPKALYNLGNALYQQGKWADAAERFGQADKYAAIKADAADAMHNLGNASMKQQKFKDAVASYENSLRLRPGDANTKMNLQMAKKKLKEAEQKEKDKQQQQQQNKQDQDQDQQPQNKQDQQPQDQQPQDQQQNQSGNPQEQPQQPEQPQPGKMKKEEAQRLLETAVDPEDQRNARKYRSAQQQNKSNTARKDW